MIEKKRKTEEKTARDFEKKEFEQKIVDLARVTRVTAGGKRLRFRAGVVIGNKNGKVGFGIAKGADVTIAINKAVKSAEKSMIEVPIINNTIPHEVNQKYKAARILIKPAKEGKGVIAGGVVRIVLEMAGIPNVVGKILSRTTNKITIAYTVMEALQSFKVVKKAQQPKSNKKIDKKEDIIS